MFVNISKIWWHLSFKKQLKKELIKFLKQQKMKPQNNYTGIKRKSMLLNQKEKLQQLTLTS